MDGLDWRSRLIAPARTLDGQPTQIVVGLLHHDGELRPAAQISDDEPVLVAEQAANELISNIRQVANDPRGQS